MWGTKNNILIETLQTIYGMDNGTTCYNALCQLLKERQNQDEEQTRNPNKKRKTKQVLVNETNYNTPCLIAYADSLIPKGMSSHATPRKIKQRLTSNLHNNNTFDTTPLQNLRKFLSNKQINVGGETISPGSIFQLLHILPFYPWDTDRGFSVKDYRKVDPRNGSWNDVLEFVDDGIGLMFDFVANHASVDNPLIQASLIQRHIKDHMGEYEKVQPYKDFVIAYAKDQKPSDEDILKLARPRPNPVLTSYYVLYDQNTDTCVAKLGDPEIDNNRDDSGGEKSTLLGTGLVWTTFSRGKNEETGKEETRQVDLNFSNINVLMEVVKILLFYIEKGAVLVRLDAIGYIWKEIGSTSLHEEKAHLLLEVLRIVLEKLSPSTVVVAEVNEPNSKLLPYLGRGKGHEECDMVYQFASYAMATHAVLRESSEWYRSLVNISAQFRGCQYVTLLGSHDGMAMKQAGELLPSDELSWLGMKLSDAPRNCLVNYATKPGGKKIVYECCGTPWAIINGDGEMKDDTMDSRVMKLARYLAVVGAGLSLRGMPAIYFNGLLCSSNFRPNEGLDENRTILRQRIDPTQLQSLTEHGTYGNQGIKGIMYLFKMLNHPDVKTHFMSSAPDPIPLVAQTHDDTREKNEKVLCVRLDDSSSNNNNNNNNVAVSTTLLLVVNMSTTQQKVILSNTLLFNDDMMQQQQQMIARDILKLDEEMFIGDDDNDKKRSNTVSFDANNSSIVIDVAPYGQMWIKVEKGNSKNDL